MTFAEKEVDDLRRAISYFVEKSDYFGMDPERIGVVGHSHGGATALIAGALDERVKAVVSIGAPARIAGFELFPDGMNRLSSLVGFSMDYKNRSEIRKRSPINYINLSYPNLLVIVGELDEFISIEESRELINSAGGENRSIDAFRKNSARMLLIEKNVNHILEIFSGETIRETIKWFDMTFYGDIKEINLETKARMGSLILGITGMLACFFPLASYLGEWCGKGRNKGRNLSIFYPLIYFPHLIILPFILFLIAESQFAPGNLERFVEMVFIISFLIFSPFLLVIRERINLSLSIKPIITGILLALFIISVSNILISGTVFQLFPEISFLILLPAVFPYSFMNEIFFREITQKKFSYLGKWKEIVASSLIFGIVFGFSAGISISLFLLLIGLPFIPLFLLLPIPLTLFGIFPSWIYQKTGNSLSTTLFVSILLSWAISTIFPVF